MAGIRKRGKSYTITAYMGYDSNGKQIKKTTTYHPPEGVSPSKADKLARIFATSWEESVTGMVTLDENKTVAELVEWYYFAVAPKILKPNILKENRADIVNHVLPLIGNEKLRNITPAKLDIMTEKMKYDNIRSGSVRMKDNALDNVGIYKLAKKDSRVTIGAFYRLKKGGKCRYGTAVILAEALGRTIDDLFEVEQAGELMGTSVNKIMGILSSIFNVAVKKEIIRRNPCANITKIKNDAKKAEYLNVEQSKELLALIEEKEDLQFNVLIKLLMVSGMRIGEALALHWEDIDFNKCEVFINHTLVRCDGEWKRQSPKTKGSIRKVLVPLQIISGLKILYEASCRKFKSHADQKPVFASPRGEYMWSGAVNRKLKRCLKGSTLPDIHIHSLRHTNASILINNHIPIKTISERLGHCRTSTTLEVYSHMFEEADRQAAELLGDKLFG